MFPILRWILLAAVIAPFILAWIVMRRHKLEWKPGEITMIVGAAAFVLVLCNGVILGRPGESVEISLQWGYPIALLACIGMAVSGFLRQSRHVDAKKPPGRQYNSRRDRRRQDRTATSRSSWSAPPSTRRWPAPAGSGGARRSRPTAPPSTPCA